MYDSNNTPHPKHGERGGQSGPEELRRRAPSEDIRASTRTARVCLRTHDASLRSARRRRVGPRVRPPLVAPSPLVFVHVSARRRRRSLTSETIVGAR